MDKWQMHFIRNMFYAQKFPELKGEVKCKVKLSTIFKWVTGFLSARKYKYIQRGKGLQFRKKLFN